MIKQSSFVFVVQNYVFLNVIPFKLSLGLSRSASKQEIKRSFRHLSRTKHPDKGGDPALWVKITRANEILSDDEKRRVYDQQGEEGLKRLEGQQGGGGGDPFSSFFNFGDFFGGGGGGNRQQGGMAKGIDLEFPLVVTLKDLYLGREFRAAHRKQKLCSHCRGTGSERPEDVKTCQTCGGRGIVIKTQRLGPGFMTQTQQTCHVCGGKGKTITSTCHQCHGHKVEIGEDILEISVERGMKGGQKIKFSGRGDESPDTQPGDISFVIVEAADPVFRREGDDLHAGIEISLIEALTGFKKFITHLDGRNIEVSQSGITIPGQVITIKEEGMPVQEYASEKGDLFLTVKVIFPQSLNEDQKQKLKDVLK